MRKSGGFIGLTYLASWLMAAAFFVLGGQWNTPASSAMAIAYMFIPMGAAIVIQKLVCKEAVKKPLGISFKPNRWFLAAWLLPPIVAFATLGVSLLLPGVEYSPEMAGLFERFESTLTPEQLEQMQAQVDASPIHPIWIGLLQGLVAGITINALVSFGEELGWRGFLQKELRHLGFWKSSAAIGLIWGIWHAPIILQGHNYPEHPLAGVLIMTLFTLLLSPIFSYVRLKANSVIAAAIIHGSLNATAGLPLMVIKGGSDLTIGITGLAGLVVLASANIGLALYDSFLASEPIIQSAQSG